MPRSTGRQSTAGKRLGSLRTKSVFRNRVDLDNGRLLPATHTLREAGWPLGPKRRSV